MRILTATELNQEYSDLPLNKQINTTLLNHLRHRHRFFNDPVYREGVSHIWHCHCYISLVSLVKAGTNECLVHIHRAKELIRELMFEGSDSVIVRAPQTSEIICGTVSFCHECAILSQNVWEVLMPFYRFPLSLARHKVL